MIAPIIALLKVSNEAVMIQKNNVNTFFSPWERLGFFPKRGEDFRTFRKRIRKSLALRKSAPLSLPPLSADHPVIAQCSEDFLKKWGSYPDWIKIYDKKPVGFPFILAQYVEQLQLEEPAKEQRFSITDCWIELPVHTKSYFSYFQYSAAELLHHEWVHAIRSVEDDDRFEELIAYLTAKSPLRRYLGPLLSDPILIRILLFFTGISLIAFLCSLFPSASYWLATTPSMIPAMQSVLLFMIAGLLSCLGNRILKLISFTRFVRRLKRKKLFPLLLRLDPRDIAALMHLKESKWGPFFLSLPGLYGISVRRLWKK